MTTAATGFAMEVMSSREVPRIDRHHASRREMAHVSRGHCDVSRPGDGSGQGVDVRQGLAAQARFSGDIGVCLGSRRVEVENPGADELIFCR